MYSRKAIVLIGPPGSGKGTQAARISAELGIPAISTGEMLRREAASGTLLGRAVSAVMAEGQLVDDELMNQVVAERLSLLDCARGFLLDGYPRTVLQARFLEGWLRQNHWDAPVALHLDIATEEVVARLAARRQCPQCGHIYTSSDDGPDVCARDGAPLFCRMDDNPTAVRERLRVYRQTADPLIDHYRTGDYHRIPAANSPEEVFDHIACILRQRQPVLAEPLRARAAQFRAAH